MDDGFTIEPEYFIPILPYSIMEAHNTPATGWNCVTHARNINDIIYKVINMI